MTKLEVSQFVPAPPEAVFDRASDFARAGDHVRAILKVEMLTEGETRVGTRFRETRKIFGKEATEEMWVTEMERPKHYALGAESCGCKYHTELRFAPEGDGTRVTMIFQGTPQTFMGKVMAFLMKPMVGKLKKLVAQDLVDLAASFEDADRPEAG